MRCRHVNARTESLLLGEEGLHARSTSLKGFLLETLELLLNLNRWKADKREVRWHV